LSIEEIVFITIIAELLEIFLQYSMSLKESILKQYSYYNKSPFLFFATHTGYIWILFLIIYYNKLNFAILLAILLKTLDIYTKVVIIQNLFIKAKGKYLDEINSILEQETPIWLYFIGLFTYPYIVYLAFS